MSLSSFQTCVPSRFLAVAAAVSLTIGSLGGPRAARGQTRPGGDQITEEQSLRFKSVRDLIAHGETEQAIQQLLGIIHQYSDSENAVREAYHYLVSIYIEEGDATTAEAKAREGLMRFPDLVANELVHLPDVNRLYTALRSQMFGTLRVVEPEGADFYLTKEGEEQERHGGKAPHVLPLVPVGTYKLRFAKSGYVDFSESITVKPGETLAVSREMEREKGLMWWLTRVGAPIAAVGAVVLALVVGDGATDSPPPDEPLPNPPDPPAN